jgi:hypothetical protein
LENWGLAVTIFLRHTAKPSVSSIKSVKRKALQRLIGERENVVKVVALPNFAVQ